MKKQTVKILGKDSTGQIDFIERWFFRHATAFSIQAWDGTWITFEYLPLEDYERDFTDPLRHDHPIVWSEEQRFTRTNAS